jgi:hypothetical protein
MVLALALSCTSPPPASAPDAPVAPAPAPAPAPPPAPASAPAPDALPHLWNELFAGGCDPAALRLWTPVELRVARNTPHAIAGRRFRTPALAALFEADGDWYHPTADDLAIPLDQAACVDRLKQREDALRSEMPIEDAFETRLLDHATFHELRDATSKFDGPLRQGVFMPTGDGGTRWTLLYRCPPGIEECSGILVECSSTGPCRVSLAG